MNETPLLRPCPSCGSERHQMRFVESPFYVVECSNCSLTYLGNPPGEEHLYDEYYSEAEPAPAAYRLDSPDPALAERYAINQQRLAWIKEQKPGGSLLDIGCGQGHFLKTAGEQGFDAFGVDVSKRAVAYGSCQFRANAAVGTLETLLAANKQYDVVTLWHVLEHFVDPYAALHEVSRLLNADGLCVIEVPNLNSLKFQLSREKWEGTNHPLYHRTFFTAKTLRSALAKTGYSHIRRQSLSYRLPGRNKPYEATKQLLNVAARDAFLDFSARKPRS